MQDNKLRRIWNRGSSFVERVTASRHVECPRPTSLPPSRRSTNAKSIAAVAEKDGLQAATQLLMDFPEIVVVCDREGTVRGINSTAESFLGHPARALLGRSGAWFLAGLGETDWRSWCESILAGCNSAPRPLQLRAMGGLCTPVQANLAPLRDPTRDIIGFMLTARIIPPDPDIHLVPKSALMLLVHEMRTPLTSVVVIADLLSSSEGIRECERRALAADIVRSAERLNRMLDDLLETPQQEEAQLEVHTRRITLEPCIQQAVRLAQMQSLTPIDLSLPQSETDVMADPDRLLQVLLNLLVNAQRHSPVGGRVFVATAVEEGQVCVSIRDQGPGIPAPQQEQIFQAFERGAEARALAPHGMGLGLYVCRSIVEKLGGRIEVLCPPEGGSLFRFTLPRARTAA